MAICKHIADNVKKIIPLGKNTRIKVIYSSLRHTPEKIPEQHYHTGNTITLLHVARITDGKGQIDAIRACEILFSNKIPFRLIFLGELDSNFKEEFYSALTNLPYRSSIELPGYTSNVSEYLESANIFIFPSKGEGLSNSFIEALSYGLVCISYNNTSFPELSEAGFEFFMAKDRNIDDLKTNLLKATEYLNTHKTPLLQNIELARDLFDRKREKDAILDILE